MTVDSNSVHTPAQTSELVSQPDLLFTYGSMTEGQVHYGRIGQFVVESVSASLKGSAYRLESGYPIFCSEGEDLVPGTLVRLTTSSTLWKVLDEMHGYSIFSPDKSLFHRLTVNAHINGQELSCQVYAINSPKVLRSASRIIGGNWEADLAQREPMVHQLTPNQRNYVQKLGRSTGRDIVPINLDLYRELMNKGLIVDKGRRLALTNLGQEVFRYLE